MPAGALLGRRRPIISIIALELAVGTGSCSFPAKPFTGRKLANPLTNVSAVMNPCGAGAGAGAVTQMGRDIMGAENVSFLSPSVEAVGTSSISYEVERQVRLDYGLLELGKFRWPGPVEIEFQSQEDRVACNLALSPRPSRGRLEQIDGPRRSAQHGLERVMLLNPGHTYRLSMPAGKVRSLYCEIDRGALEELLAGPADLSGHNWQSQFRARMPVIELLLNRMYEELRHESFASELALDAYSRALGVELARCLRSGSPDPGLRKGGLAPWRMRNLRDRIYADAPAPRLPELADLCEMTVRQLSRAFKQETGRALGAYILDATIERAVMLLTQTDRSIAQIALELGFASSTSFSYSFRCSTGVLPREVRRRGALA